MGIYLPPVEGGTPRQLANNAASDDLARWSRDGRILFQSDRNGSVADYSMNIDGSDPRLSPRDSVVSVSPDRTVLLFESTRDGRGALFTMDAARARARRISPPLHVEQGSFSPDGQAIVWEQRAATHDNISLSDIVVAGLDGSQPTRIASGTDPSWSPDGRTILFKSWDERTRRLWISMVSPSGTDFRRLAPGVRPAWSPDGARIVYMRDREGGGGVDIWVMNRDGSAERCITC